ncbi:DUF397 domain-containing protein [Micromonospora qiuiae]
MTQQIAHLLDCVQRGGVLIHIISAELSIHVGLDGPLTLTGATWRKSTRSGSSECAEVADNLPGVIGVRDSKDTAGPTLAFTRPVWRSIIAYAKRS